MATRSKKKSSWGCALTSLVILLLLTSMGISFKRDWVETTGRVESVEVKNDVDLLVHYSYKAPGWSGKRRKYRDKDVVPRIRYPMARKGSQIPVVYTKGWLGRSAIGTAKNNGNRKHVEIQAWSFSRKAPAASLLAAKGLVKSRCGHFHKKKRLRQAC